MPTDDEYKSPLSTEVQAAVGRVVTAWAAMEHTFKVHIARLIAITVEEDGTAELNSEALIKSLYLAGAGGFDGMLKQTWNLAKLFDEESAKAIKSAGDRISEVKAHRDALCHSVTNQTEPNQITIRSISASRAKPFVDKTYSVAEMDAWCEKIVKNSRIIDAEVAKCTGWSASKLLI